MQTIETAYIVPLIFFIILAFMELEFYMLDVAKVMSGTSIATSYISESLDKSEDEVTGEYSIEARNAMPLYNRSHIEDEMRLSDRIDTIFDGRLLLLEMNRSEVDISKGVITVDLSFEANHPIFKYFKVSPIRYGTRIRTEVGDYSDVMRKKAVLSKLKENVKHEE